MNKSISKFLAASMAATMALSMSAFAASSTLDYTSQSNSAFEGSQTIVVPTYKITVPGEFSIAINPLKVGDDITHQIYSAAPYDIANKSTVGIDVNVQVGAKLPITGVKPVPATEDVIAANSLDATNVNKSFALYVSPITKITNDVAFEKLDHTDDENAPQADYIGVGTAPAVMNIALAASNKVTDGTTPAYGPPDAAGPSKAMQTSFMLYGSCNKNATWANDDIKPTITIKFAGVDSEGIAFLKPLAAYTDAKVYKAANGAGSAMVATPRIRNKQISVTNVADAAEPFIVEYNSNLLTFLKANSGAALTVTALTMLKDGVADTKTILPADLSAATPTKVVITTSADEGNKTGELVFAKDLFTEGSTYTITGFTITAKVGTTVTGTFAAAAGGNATIVC